MPDTFFSNKANQKDNNFCPRSALTAVVEIMDYNYFVESDKFHELHSFFNELANEIHNSQRQNYRRGFGVIRPEIQILNDRIYVNTFLYLEDNVPELNSLIFNLFVETCNMLLAVALKHEMVVRGYAGIDALIKSNINSECSSWLEKEDTLMLSDMLKVFSFDEIFPEGLDKVFIPMASFPIIYSRNFMNASSMLSEINAVGIYMSDTIRNFPFAEVAILSDLLVETTLKGEKIFLANWLNWVDKHPDAFSVDEVRESISRLSMDTKSNYYSYWKSFGEFYRSYSL